MTNNFYVLVDEGGKMPIHTTQLPKTHRTHRNYVQYVDNKPVALGGNTEVLGITTKWDGTKHVPHPRRVWCYKTKQFVLTRDLPYGPEIDKPR